MTYQAHNSLSRNRNWLIDHIGDEKIPRQLGTAVGNIGQWPKG